jgi:GNAT superfamily N-acetyltransferase
MNTNNSTTIAYRPGTPDDSYTVFKIFEYTYADLSKRMGATTPTSAADPKALARMWAERRSLYEHLARTAEHFWLAEKDGEAIGFARSIYRDGVRQLTEYFVLPVAQSAGVGRELLKRVFPEEGARHRSIISSPDMAAQSHYLKAGVYPRFPLYYFSRKPEVIAVVNDLVFESITGSQDDLDMLGKLDQEILAYQRDADHQWLSSERQGYLYRREGKPVGYGYTGIRNGPFVLLEASDFPAVLAHAESTAAQQRREHFGVEVPMVNRKAVDYLLKRGFRMDAFIAMLMNDKLFGKLENYITTSPPFFL